MNYLLNVQSRSHLSSSEHGHVVHDGEPRHENAKHGAAVGPADQGKFLARWSVPCCKTSSKLSSPITSHHNNIAQKSASCLTFDHVLTSLHVCLRSSVSTLSSVLTRRRLSFKQSNSYNIVKDYITYSYHDALTPALLLQTINARAIG